MAKEEKKLQRLSDGEVGNIAKELIKHEFVEHLNRKIGDLAQKLNISKEKLGYVCYVVLKEIVAETEKKIETT